MCIFRFFGAILLKRASEQTASPTQASPPEYICVGVTWGHREKKRVLIFASSVSLGSPPDGARKYKFSLPLPGRGGLS